jgi:hypothetical protein
MKKTAIHRGASTLAIAALAAVFGACSAPLRDGDSSDAGPCPMTTATTTRCSGSCTDTQTDPRHCGGCGRACRPGFACAAGACANQCATGFLSCNGECIDPQTEARFCGASLDCMGANAGRVCSRVEQCVGGLCAIFEAPRSEISPFPDAVETSVLSVPRPVRFTIGSILSGRVYYTLDGTEPRPDAPTTRTELAPVTVPVGGSEGVTVTLRWYVEYGGFYGREPTTRQRLVRVSQPSQLGFGAIFEGLTLNGSGATALVEPGSTVTVRFTGQEWRPSPGQPCVTCALTRWFAADLTDTTSGQFARSCFELRTAAWPGEENSEYEYRFPAPMTRGRYAVRYGTTLDFATNCGRYRGGAPIAFFYVR